MNIMKTSIVLSGILLGAASFVGAATNDLTSAIQRGLFEEEANQNLGAAIQAYQTVANQFDKDRKLAATAIFRLGECYRKEGNTNDAAVQYERILREFSDQPTLVTLSRQNLATLGGAPANAAASVLTDAARQAQKRLLDDELAVVQKQLESQQKQVQVGAIPPDAVLPTERDLLQLKRQAAALDAGLPVSITATETTAPAASTEADEVRRIQALIKESPDLINAPDRKGETLLQSAAAKGKLAVVKSLLDSGAAVDGLRHPGLTPLHYAAANGHKAVVDLLLSRGAKADAQTEGGVTPLHLAAMKGYESVAKALLAAGAPVNAKGWGKSDTDDLQYDIHVTQTPLHLAAYAGYTGMVELLLANGADPNAVDGADRTPLSYATQRHYDAIVQALLGAHADPNAGGRDLALATAAYEGDVTALKLLLANAADPNTNSLLTWSVQGRELNAGYDYKFTPLVLAVIRRNTDAVTELLRAKADPNVPDPRGNPPLYNALVHIPTLKALLEGGADPNARTADGSPMLVMAVWDQNEPAVKLLLAHQAEVNAASGNPNFVGVTALHAAASIGNTNIAELLLQAGADVNAREKDGSTPLHEAVNHDHPELAELLLANKADPNVRNTVGQTPLDLAKSQAQSAQGRTPGPGFPVPRPMLNGPPFAYQWQLNRPGASAATPPQEPKPDAMVALLRQHGALDDLPKVDRIIVQRLSTGDRFDAFRKGAHDWGQFSLLDLIGVEYEFLAGSPNEGGRDVTFNNRLFASSHTHFPFPDLAHLRIRRPAPGGKSWLERTVDLRPVFEAGDCSKDVRLEWGDVVDIPEADHPLNEKWPGFSRTELANLKKCLTRQVEIVINGQATNITLAPEILYVGEEKSTSPFTPGAPTTFSQRLEALRVPSEPGIVAHTPFWLKAVLLQSQLVLTSSDLRHVKVTCRDPASGQEREWVVDCSEASPAPDFWLRDGDKIEVPERTDSASAEEEMPAQPSSAGQSAPHYTQRLQNIIPRRQAIYPEAPPPATGVAEGASSYSQRLTRIMPASGTPESAAGEKQPRFTQRLQQIIPRGSESPQAVEADHLNVGGVLYSPKSDDAELLKAGYQRDQSARTRVSESWDERANAALRGRACPAVWTGSDMVVFGGEGMGTSFDDGARYNLAEDTWAMLPEKDAPSSRTGHAMVWTGKEVIVWGGFGGVWGNDINHNDGARYNPATDIWKPVSTRNAPAARFDTPAVWTGKEMLVWGGYTNSHSRYQGAHADAYLNTGGRYNPASDTWKPITTQGAPSRRSAHTLLWTGKEIIVWGGGNANKVLSDGALYNPARDAWRPISTEGAPSPRGSHVSVWTGKEMIIWGGSTRDPSDPSDYFEDGARYNPETDTWKPISTIGAPKGRVCVNAVWTGTEMVLWGGVNDAQANGLGDFNRYVGTGARYNPATDTWTEITTTGAPSPRLTCSVWAGNGLLTFGGYNGRHLNDTWFYSPQRTLYPYSKP